MDPVARHVVATAGHVDHGKSTLVRALTGIEPDRWAEEHRRGLTIDLGFAWTGLPSGRDVAFVDVPGHQRFLGNMLAGLGPVPVVCFLVAADAGWQQQSSDHRDAVAALDIGHGLLVISKADRAPDRVPAVLAQARQELSGTGLRDAPAVAVSAVTGAGLDDLRGALDQVLAAVPAPATTGRVRLWVDRSFSISGAGTVATGTLAGGTLVVGDELHVAGADQTRTATVRGLQSRDTPLTTAVPVDRVAVNLRGVHHRQVRRGDALITPDAWPTTAVVDVRLVSGQGFTEAPSRLTVHVGTAALPARLRSFDADHARITLPRSLPLVVGDRLVLRDPGRRDIVGGAVVLDAEPPALRRRGDGHRRARSLAGMHAADTPAGPTAGPNADPSAGPTAGSGTAPDDGSGSGSGDQPAMAPPDTGLAAEIARRQAVQPEHLVRLGAIGPGADPPAGVLAVAGWWVHEPVWESWRRRLHQAVAEAHHHDPLTPGLSLGAAGRLVPEPSLLALLAAAAGLEQHAGHLRLPGTLDTLGPIEQAVGEVENRLRDNPFQAPEAADLQALGLGTRELAAAERAGRILRLRGEVVLLPAAPALAMRELAGLPQPFTTSSARQALHTTRRVVIPLLEHLDVRGWTRRIDAGHREIVRPRG